MPTNGNAPLAGKGAFKNTLKKYYTRLDNLIISLVMWRFLPVSLVDWIINRGEKRHD